ncbi:MAG: GH3 auxin-responsive promoter family protein [Alistipes sp.]|nr:GH3 auxin-responsive promoter family protein [Alistipes sp.]
MTFLTQIIRKVSQSRLAQIDTFRRHPLEVQQQQLHKLLQQGCRTQFGQHYGLEEGMTPSRFAAQVPLHEYADLAPWIDRMRQGEAHVLWPSMVRWFAKSSGTTSSKSKFIPVTAEGLSQCHLRGPRDIVALVADRYPDTHLFAGKTLTLGGSHQLTTCGGRAQEGDLSAILIENTPWFASTMRIPRPQTALIADFEQKVAAICREAVTQNVTAFAGVPSWNLVMLKKVLEYTGKQNLLEVWPRLELFTHGGMNFKPYQQEYRRLIPSDAMKYMDTYNASEGFFGIQDDPQSEDLLLMLDYGTYYEFLPTDALADPSQVVPLEGVRTGVNYAMILTSCNGLWRYMIGDTVEFTSLQPYKIRITGRTRHFMNAFGEEVIVDNAETALHQACSATGAVVCEYTAGPVYMTDRSKGSHEWVVEFCTPPSDRARFARELDRALQQVNSDYEAKRFKDTTLLAPRLTVVPTGTFFRWMSQRGKVGGQNKVPRLFNDRTYLDQLHALVDAADRHD